MSRFGRLRAAEQLQSPKVLKELNNTTLIEGESLPLKDASLEALFPNTFQQPLLHLQSGTTSNFTPMRVGVVLSGGQAAGGHNVICALFDALKKGNQKSSLLGFLDGPIGIIKNNSIELTEEHLASYRNHGGFDLIGSGRDKIESAEQLQQAAKAVKDLSLDGLVVIGGDDSNTNAAILAEYFLQEEIPCSVVGVPKTIDGDLKNDHLEISFGFDTACKIYSDIIGNIARDALSAGKYYFFIKMMGRAASHITLEAALQTHPNLALIGEEIEEEKATLNQIVQQIADLVEDRSKDGKNYGVILIPEGLIEFIPEVKQLIQELNHHLSTDTQFDPALLTEPSRSCFDLFPSSIQKQLLSERDPHGNVQVSKIETERLLIQMVRAELKSRGAIPFHAQPHFCGYEGRSAFPSFFDAHYCSALGTLAGFLLQNKKTGYLCSIKNLTAPIEEWVPVAIPLVPLMVQEERKGKLKPVISKALIDLKGQPFLSFKKERNLWEKEDQYRYPGSIQYDGSKEIVESRPLTLQMESVTYQDERLTC